MSVNPTHAIVIGGSIAGLLNARVLSDHFDQVTIIERDTLPEDNSLRAGAPQARHLHTLLVRGSNILEDLFPNFDQDVIEAGGIRARWGLQNAFLIETGWTPHFDGGYTSNILSRRTLEWLVRRRVMAIANVSVITETDVQGLVVDQTRRRVTGVHIKSRADKTERELFADLIVDASGRKSKAPQWLQALGYDVPEKTIITAHTGYATRWYQLPENHTFDQACIAVQPVASKGFYRGGGYITTENNQVVVTVMGANGDVPPTDEEGFTAFLNSLPTSALADIARASEPVSPIYGYRNLENQMMHYERLTHRPDNFIVTGDAAVAFNPIYGQGMSTAAIEAELLDTMLKRRNVLYLGGFAANFQKRLHKAVQGPWMMSVTEDLRYPDVEGQAATLKARFMQKYFDYVIVAMPHDTEVTRCFFDVMNLLKSPEAFTHPRIVARVIWHNIFSRRRAQQPDALSPQVRELSHLADTL